MADYTVKCRESGVELVAAVACICIAVYVIGRCQDLRSALLDAYRKNFTSVKIA